MGKICAVVSFLVMTVMVPPAFALECPVDLRSYNATGVAATASWVTSGGVTQLKVVFTRPARADGYYCANYNSPSNMINVFLPYYPATPNVFLTFDSTPAWQARANLYTGYYDGDSVACANSEAECVLYGRTGDDTLECYGTNCYIDGSGGNDLLIVYGGNDSSTVYGGDGDDDIYGSPYDDHLEGGLGVDWIYADLGCDHVYGDVGWSPSSTSGDNDYIYLGPEDGSPDNCLTDQSAFGGAGADSIVGSSGRDQIEGGAGGDFLLGNGGIDRIYGSAYPGSWANDGSDMMFGGEGNDCLCDRNVGDVDLFDGGPDTDRYHQVSGSDTLSPSTETPDSTICSSGCPGFFD